MVRRTSMLKVFFWSFFVQASWNFERMQGLGFAASIAPAIDDIYGDEASKRTAMRRHLAHYNAHPYMASPVLGATINLEERVRSGEIGPSASADFKTKVMSVYGAIGDSFYWSSIRPLASCLGVLTALVWGLWGPVAFLLFYNAFHLWMRWRGLAKGYELGEGVVGYIKSLGLPDWGVRARYAGVAVLGLIAPVAVWAAFDTALSGEMLRDGKEWGLKAAYLAMAGGAVGSAVMLNMLLRRGLTVKRLVYMVIPPLVAYGLIAR